MSWHERFRERSRPHAVRTGTTQVESIAAIPCEATQAERFRLTVGVERICERPTKTGDPCYFLNCRDAQGMTFSVVCWDWQWTQFGGRVAEGATLPLDVRVPKDGFSAFTLA